jgi:hypothetical protein
MTHDLSAAIAGLLKSIDDAKLNYVVYRDHDRDDRIVVLVEGASEDEIVRAALSAGGARVSEADAGFDLVVDATDASGRSRRVEVQVKTTQSKGGVSNLLWRAATTESAHAARRSVEKSS